MPPAARRSAAEELMDLYRELDARVDALGAQCLACGSCCTFPPDGPILYATLLERSLLAAEPQPSGATGPRACPYLDGATMRCEAHRRRTIGCRTHFCERALPSARARQKAHELAEWALSRLRRIVEAYGLEWDYAPVVDRLRPLDGEVHCLQARRT